MAHPGLSNAERGEDTTCSPSSCKRLKREVPEWCGTSGYATDLLPLASKDLALPGFPVSILDQPAAFSKEWDAEYIRTCVLNKLDAPCICTGGPDDPFNETSISGVLSTEGLERADTQTSEATSASETRGSYLPTSAAHSDVPLLCANEPCRGSAGFGTPFANPEYKLPFEPVSPSNKRKATATEQQSSQSTVIISGIHSSPYAASNKGELEPNNSVEPDLDLYVDQQNVATQLPAIPQNVRLTFNRRFVLAPVLLRGKEGFIAANVGLRVHRIDHEPSAPLALHSMLQPSVITTGIPPLPSAKRRRDMKAIQSTQATTSRMTTRTGMKLRNACTLQLNSSTAHVSPVQRDDICVEEAFLLQRDEHSGALLAIWHANGEELLDGKFLKLPNWSGDTWVVDVVARVADLESSNMWVKAQAVRLTYTF
eukprot:jgi/Botrbrau1/18389/Bobra.152_1s0001.1